MLTSRESTVGALLVRGLSNKSIGKELGISPRTVQNHLRSVYAKLRVQNRTQAAVRLA